MTIPVLPFIPGGGPLLVGEDFLLHHPTPLQWKTLEECLHNHQLYLRDAATTTNVVGIDAAPLVAFMDELTSAKALEEEEEGDEGRRRRGVKSKYATIAAIVGISSSQLQRQRGGSNSISLLDTSSTTSFMESLQLLSGGVSSDGGGGSSPRQGIIQPSQSTIRLVGIGRAALSFFHSRLPNSCWQAKDDDEQTKQQQQGVDRDMDDNDDCRDETPLLMAQFRLLTDTDQRSEKARQEGQRSRFVSPVHAVNEMSQWAAKLNYRHDDRQRLVRGLQAAKARLDMASSSSREFSSSSLSVEGTKVEYEDDYYNEPLEDHDGLGQLSFGFVLEDDDYDDEYRKDSQGDIDTLLQDFAGGHKDRRGTISSSTTTATTTTNDSTTALDQVLQWENYGLGYTASAVSSIPPLTRMLMDKLQAYYSPEKQATEEYYYELLSFMAVLSLKYCCTSGTTITTATMTASKNQSAALQWALKCTNTMERMAWAYEQMGIHRQLLKDASEEASAALRECGEECTDLW
jgi:hypothetical protein